MSLPVGFRNVAEEKHAVRLGVEQALAGLGPDGKRNLVIRFRF
jgi:hypothetical protein